MKNRDKHSIRGMIKCGVCISMAMIMILLTGCGGSKAESQVVLEGSLNDILDQVYEAADFSAEQREAMEFYQTTEITDENAEYLIGTTDVDYVEAVYSAPAMSSVAYQCVLLRLQDGADVEKAKEALTASADPRKWVCVEAESVVVENVGDVILFMMADTQSVEAVKTAFLNLTQ